jgi:putative transposase
MSRQRSHRVVQRGEVLLPRIHALKAEHPFWGYRRIWAYLRAVEQLPIKKKRMLRLMREHQLLVQPNPRLQARRTPMARKPKPTRPNEWWGLDMTKVLVSGFGWVSIVVVLDWYTKKIVGYSAGLRCTAKQWLEALDVAVNGQFLPGVRGQGLSLMCDSGCQPRPLSPFWQRAAPWRSSPSVPAITTPRAMPIPSASGARSKKSAAGSRNGPVPLP